MIYEQYETEYYTFIAFDKSTDEWNRVRSLCLQESDNWLRENYTEQNCVVEDHDIFCIAYDKKTGRPVSFGGVYNNGRYDPRVARTINRFYVFPEFREVDTLKRRMATIHNNLIPFMQEVSPIKRDLLFISMQTRDRDYYGEQVWWTAWKRFWMIAAKDWVAPDGLVQVVAGEDPRCFQNIVYKEYNNFKFSDWNPKQLTFAEHEELIERHNANLSR